MRSPRTCSPSRQDIDVKDQLSSRSLRWHRGQALPTDANRRIGRWMTGLRNDCIGVARKTNTVDDRRHDDSCGDASHDRPLGTISSSRCQITRSQKARGLDGERIGLSRTTHPRHGNELGQGWAINRLVEPDGIEPTTSCLQSRRSPS